MSEASIVCGVPSLAGIPAARFRISIPTHDVRHREEGFRQIGILLSERNDGECESGTGLTFAGLL